MINNLKWGRIGSFEEEKAEQRVEEEEEEEVEKVKSVFVASWGNGTCDQSMASIDSWARPRAELHIDSLMTKNEAFSHALLFCVPDSWWDPRKKFDSMT